MFRDDVNVKAFVRIKSINSFNLNVNGHGRDLSDFNSNFAFKHSGIRLVNELCTC